MHNMIEGYYINLDERTDRMYHFEYMKRKYPFFKKIKRLSAVKNNNGAIGCGMSHIKALAKIVKEYCINNNNNNNDYFIVCEDDLCILNDSNYNAFVKDFDLIKDKVWDIIVITPRGDKMQDVNFSDANTMTIHNNFHRIYNNQTATGYIIKKNFIPILISNFKESTSALVNGENPNIYAIDQWWKQLQHEYKFYYYSNIYAGQLVGYSNIENKLINYNERFLRQL